MEIESISNKALRRFFLTGNSKGLVGDVERLRAMPAFIAAPASLDELARPPNDGLHRLIGNRADTWSMTVKRNWRLTFTVIQTFTVTDMNVGDYRGSQNAPVDLRPCGTLAHGRNRLTCRIHLDTS
jgi:toxin HigB-1